MATFLVKSEPSVYPFEQLRADKKTSWDGVRNFEARNNMRAMKKGDTLLYYHSNEGKEIVGVAKVTKTAYADPTAEERRLERGRRRAGEEAREAGRARGSEGASAALEDGAREEEPRFPWSP